MTAPGESPRGVAGAVHLGLTTHLQGRIEIDRLLEKLLLLHLQQLNLLLESELLCNIIVASAAAAAWEGAAHAEIGRVAAHARLSPTKSAHSSNVATGPPVWCAAATTAAASSTLLLWLETGACGVESTRSHEVGDGAAVVGKCVFIVARDCAESAHAAGVVSQLCESALKAELPLVCEGAQVLACGPASLLLILLRVTSDGRLESCIASKAWRTLTRWLFRRRQFDIFTHDGQPAGPRC